MESKSKRGTSKNSLTDRHQDGQLSDDGFSKSPISKLPVECLVDIFSLLPITDRVRIQRVCKHWRDVSMKSWLSIKTLGFKEEDWGLKSSLGMGIDPIVFEKVLKLCGPYVTRIDFSEYCDGRNKSLTESESLFATIKNLCPNLKGIDIRGTTVTVQGLECLAKSYSNLTEFAIDTCNFSRTNTKLVKPLSLLFKNNQNLRRVVFHVPHAENCLLDLNPIAIEEISIKHGQIDKEIIFKALNRYINLRSLYINYWDSFDGLVHSNKMYINEMFKSIAPHSENLKELEISSDLLFEINSESFKRFKNLKELWLRGEELLIDLSVVSRYCRKLTYLKLSDLPVTDLEIARIMQLPELQELYLWCLNEITDVILTNYAPSLKILDCYQCPGLTNLGFLKLALNSSEALRKLTITECENVNVEKLIQDVKKATHTRSRRNSILIISRSDN